jgi:hypothetical protein
MRQKLHKPKKKAASPGSGPGFQMDVHEGLVDDKHPKDTIRGGPKDAKQGDENTQKKNKT